MAKDPKYTTGLVKCSVDTMSYSAAVAVSSLKKETTKK